MDTVQPAKVSILAIYNPSLGNDDESLADQILYYYSAPSQDATGKPDESNSEERERNERNQRLRQIGLAQGLVQFGKFVIPACSNS